MSNITIGSLASGCSTSCVTVPVNHTVTATDIYVWQQKLMNDYIDYGTTALTIKPKEEQKNMFYNHINIDSNTLEGKQKNYLLNRSSTIAQEKNREMEKTFGLSISQDWPKTNKEAIERIKAGKFQIAEKLLGEPPYGGEDEDGHYTDGLMEAIRWTEVPEDRDGYSKAYKNSESDLVKARDGIVVASDATSALAILEKFEGTKH